MSEFWNKAGKILAQVAPALGTAIGGPFGGLAVKAIEGALGLDGTGGDDAAAAAVAGATPDQLLALKKADQDFVVALKKLDIDVMKIDADDRASARQREVSTGDATPKILAALVICGYAAVQYVVLTTVIDQSMRDIVMRSLGTLDAALGLVLSYYFGSSAGSRVKDEALSRMVRG